MFGDNESVVKSSMIPESTLSKRHIRLSFHRVRECIASNIVKFFHIPGTENLSDVLTKFTPHCTFWPLIKPVLFWQGDTADLQGSRPAVSSLVRGVTAGVPSGVSPS